MARKQKNMNIKQIYKADIVTVAKVAGVSPATVSRAINHPELVSAPTRKKIEKAVRKTGYIRNRAAQTMHGRRSATLGLVVPTVNYSIFAELVQSFNDAVSELGFTLLLATHNYDLRTEYKVIRKLLEHRVDGIAVIGLDHSEDTYQLFKSQNVPVVAVWSYSDTSRISCIGSDNREAGHVAAQHILSLGHHQIGFIFPPILENDRARGRLDAAKDVLRAAGLASDENKTVQSLYSIAQSKAAAQELLTRDTSLTALICGNDVIAQGAIAAAMELGLRIPQDISIIGIGDFVGSGDSYPALTTVRIPAQEIGARAGQNLVQNVADLNCDLIVNSRFPVSLKQRATTAFLDL
jgi:LacI family transcriptional regulator